MVNKISAWGFTASISLFVIIHFVSLLVTSELLFHVLSLCGILALLFALILLKKAAVLPFFLLLLATIAGVTGTERNIFDVFWEGSRAMRALVSMILVIPAVAWVLKQEDYVEGTILYVKKWLKSSKTFYFAQMLITQLISFFLLFGSIAVVYQMVQAFFGKRNSPAWQTFKSTAVLRGFATSTIWLLSMPSFAYNVEVFDAPLFMTFAQGFLLSVAGLLLAVVFLHVYEKSERLSLSRDIRETIASASEINDDRCRERRMALEFISLFLSLLVMTFVANAFIPVGLLTIIPLVVITWAIGYFVWKRKLSALTKESKTYVAVGIASKAQECSIMLTAGLLITALNASDWSEGMMQGVHQVTSNVPGLNFLWVLPLIVMLLGFLGMGPLTVMVLIAGIVKSIHLPYPPEIIVLALTLGSSLSLMFSPVVIPVLVLSSVNGLSPIKNSFQQNWKFAIGFYFLVELYMQMRVL